MRLTSTREGPRGGEPVGLSCFQKWRQFMLNSVKSNTSIKTVMVLPTSYPSLSVTQASWQLSRAHYSPMEKSLVPLDSATHPILQRTFPEASAMNHRSACLILSRWRWHSYQYSTYRSMWRHSCPSKRNKAQLANSVILPLTKRIKQPPTGKWVLRPFAKQYASVYFWPSLSLPHGDKTEVPEDLLVST